MRNDLIVPDFIGVYILARWWLLSVVCVISIIPGVFLECVDSCVWYLVIVHSSVICLRKVSSWTSLGLASHVIYLQSVSSVVVIIIVAGRFPGR